MITPDEQLVFSFYATSELAGSIILGRLALRTPTDRIRASLIEHCSEESRHAWLFTKLILDLGGTPVQVETTYQDHVIKTLGRSASLIDLLWLSQFLEIETLAHYRRHAALPGLDPLVRKAFDTIIEDEVGHVDWVANELELQRSEISGAYVEESKRRTREATTAALSDLSQSRVGLAYLRLEEAARRSADPTGLVPAS